MKPRLKEDSASEPAEMICPACRQRTRMIPKTRLWFTLFLCPVFPVSERTSLVQCEKCGVAFRMTADDLKRRLEKAQVSADGEAMQAAIRLYSELREHPTDSVLLDRTMRAYANAGEFGEAISAARHFPAALVSSASCQETLRQIEAAARENLGSESASKLAGKTGKTM